VVCLEPSVLLRERVTGQSLEDSLSISPSHESVLFTNRNKFDLIAIYDASSETYGDKASPLTAFVRAVYENEFRKILKNVPTLLVGGLEAWKRELGDEEVSRTGMVGEINKFNAVPSSGSLPVNGNSNVGTGSAPTPAPHQLWNPHSQQDSIDGLSFNNMNGGYQASHHTRESAETNHTYGGDISKFTRGPAIPRPPSSTSPPSLYQGTPQNVPGPSMHNPQSNGFSPVTYPQFHRPPTTPPSSFTTPPASYTIASPAPASINQTLSRRRSDFYDQSQETLSGLKNRQPIGYPDLPSQQILRPPPAVASSALERQDNRPRVVQHDPPSTGPAPPRINSDYPVTYWSDINIGTAGLKNLGNTCYMNAMVQCLNATVPFARFFIDGRWKAAVNYMNPEGTKGELARGFAAILHEMSHSELPSIVPSDFRRVVTKHREEFRNTDQHDSQEFLIFLLDGLHEDLNRILNKPTLTSSPKREAELEVLAQQISSEQEWQSWRTRDDSIIIDYFQGQFRNRLQCLTCQKTSTTFNSFRSLQLPVLSGKTFGKVTLTQCLDAFVKEEIMDGNDKWACPTCKTLRKATKHLSISRLPPVLVIQLKRFESHGRFTDKIDTFVDFPLKSLDLTSYVPPPLPAGADPGQINGGQHLSPDDPRSQTPPYRYDLYGVTNHFGGGTGSGHYTAFISSRGGWVYCDDSVVKTVDAKQVVVS
jgi:ubiquitin carboxyl-terminal hydrolase 8